MAASIGAISLPLIFWASIAVLAIEPNPPTWPASVTVFGPDMPVANILSVVQAAYARNGGPSEHGQFSPERFAFLFKPGSYNVDVPVGYYTQVSGLGLHPTDVVFTSAKGVYCEEANEAVNPGALDTFWRAAENFQTDANFPWNGNGHKGMIWAASQASSLRRIVVTNDLQLYQLHPGNFEAGYASGGFLGNSEVRGVLDTGSQQQFLARTSRVGLWVGGVWNIVTVGVEGARESHCGADPKACSHPYTNVGAAPLIAEKPFLSVDSIGRFQLNVPKVITNRVGVDYSGGSAIDFEHIYVADATVDTAATINAKLKVGRHVVLSPGIYELNAALELNMENQVLLGLGLATLVPTNGNAVVKVGNVSGVRVAGILAQAGSQLSETLIEWGSKGFECDAANPGVMNDIFARVGGPANPVNAQANSMLVINAGNVILDNAWLWRADHVEGGALTKNGELPCQVASIINGNDVTSYGFKAEHCLTDQVQWNGENGKTFMFQAEMPYDVTQGNFGDRGYVGYRVGSNVRKHFAAGIGVYHYFRDYAVTVPNVMSAPTALESSFIAPLAVFLNGQGVAMHILNDKGPTTARDMQKPTEAVPGWLCVAAPSVFTRNGTCHVGDPVSCPGSTAVCAGNTCCWDGSTCPSATQDFGCCSSPKKADCTNPGPPTAREPLPPTSPSVELASYNVDLLI